MKIGDKVKIRVTATINSEFHGNIGVIVAIERESSSYLSIRVRMLDGNYSGSSYWFNEKYIKKINTHICKLVCDCNPREAVLL